MTRPLPSQKQRAEHQRHLADFPQRLKEWSKNLPKVILTFSEIISRPTSDPSMIQPNYYNADGQPISATDYHHHYRDYYHLRNLFNQLDNEHPNPHPTQTIAKTQ